MTSSHTCAQQRSLPPSRPGRGSASRTPSRWPGCTVIGADHPDCAPGEVIGDAGFLAQVTKDDLADTFQEILDARTLQTIRPSAHADTTGMPSPARPSGRIKPRLTGRGEFRTAVVETSALASLAVPRADNSVDTNDAPDPLQYLLTNCDVPVPPEVVAKLRELAQYQDIYGSAAGNVLAAREHYTVTDPDERTETPACRPAFGLDEGETDGIVFANTLDVDGFLTDEFGGTNFALITRFWRSHILSPHYGSSATALGTVT